MFGRPEKPVVAKDDDMRDRDVWTRVSRHWYGKAMDKAPATGRVFHHIAPLARPHTLQQLLYYAQIFVCLFTVIPDQEIIIRWFGDPNVLPYMHTPSVFMFDTSPTPGGFRNARTNMGG
jgi:hypothetical protein